MQNNQAFLIALFSIAFSQIAFSQVQDKSYTDCAGSNESIYETIGQGKPLLIASKGLDCSICMSQAAEVQEFAAMYPAVRVWGAMNYRYSQALPTCAASNIWRTTYSWNDIFMFLDLTDEWQGLSYPTYYVISPVDSLIAYQGPNFNSASEAALSLIPSAVNPVNDSGFEIVFNENNIRLNCISARCEEFTKLALVNLSGQLVFSADLKYSAGQSESFDIPESISPGIYFIRLSGRKGLHYSKKVLIG